MQEDIMNLQKEFERIKNMGWIKETMKGKGSGGYTFESLLKKERDAFPVPDYGNIEIKTINKNTKTNLHLFNLTPDGDYLFPIKRILLELGCPCKDDKNLKSFYRSFSAVEYTPIIYSRRGKIRVNYIDEKIELIIINNKLENVNVGISWSFNYLRERLNLKLQYLAIVRTISNIISGIGYYHYDNISFYCLKDFNTFISLIERGVIVVSFKISMHKEKEKYGQVYDHGTDFSIDVSNIELLYNKISLTKDQKVFNYGKFEA